MLVDKSQLFLNRFAETVAAAEWVGENDAFKKRTKHLSTEEKRNVIDSMDRLLNQEPV